MSDLFADLGNFRFPDTRMNQGPLPSVVGGPAGSDGTPDGVINGTNKLLGKITPYAMGEAARTGSDRNYQQVPHRVQQIVQQVAVPDPIGTALVHIPHVVDNGELAFILLSNERSIFASPYHHYGRNNPPSIPQFGNLDVVNYILCCLQMEINRVAAPNAKNLWDSTFQTLLMGTQTSTRTSTYDKWKTLTAAEKVKFYFQVATYLVSTLFLPFGICAGSEKQGGQHEGGFAPVQSAVNYVTTMTVDGQNRDLMNYWHGHTVNGGDRLILTLQLSEFSDRNHVQPFSLNSYYKKPVAQSVQVGTEPFWQLKAHVYGCSIDKGIPGIDLGDYDYRRRGYWHIAQTFQCRKGDRHKRGFENAPPLQVTFSPVWQRMDQFKGVPGAPRLAVLGPSGSGSVPIPARISVLLGKYPDLYGILLVYGIHILKLNGPLQTQETILNGAGVYMSFNATIQHWQVQVTNKAQDRTIQSLHLFLRLCVQIPGTPLCQTMKGFTEDLLNHLGETITDYQAHTFSSEGVIPDPSLISEIDNVRGTFSATEDDEFYKFLTALCERPKDYIDESNDYAKDCMFLSSLFYICGLKQDNLDGRSSFAVDKLTLFSKTNVRDQLSNYIDVKRNTDLKKDIFKETGYYFKVGKAMKVVRELELEKYNARKVGIEVALTNIGRNYMAFSQFWSYATYDPSSTSHIYDEIKLFYEQYQRMSEFEVKGFELTNLNDALNEIIVRINRGVETPEQVRKDKDLLQSMKSSMDSFYTHKRALLIYTALFMNELKILSTKANFGQYETVLGYPKTEVTDLQTFANLKNFVLYNLNTQNIQLSQSYVEIVRDIKHMYPTFQEHAIMKFVCETAGWIDDKVGVSRAKTHAYVNIFDSGTPSEFYLGGELGTFGTAGCVASGGAALASVASVPGDSGAVAMPVVEEPAKTVARRAPKKIRFDVDARYPSIAEEAAGGESAA